MHLCDVSLQSFYPAKSPVEETVVEETVVSASQFV